MSNKVKNDQPSDGNSEGKAKKPNQRPPIDPSQIVNPSEDLVYKGGYTNDPAEVLANPAVAPEMLDDQRDNRPDLTRDSEGI